MGKPKAVVVGYGFAGRSFHSYLIGLDTGLDLHGIVSRSPETREKIAAERNCRTYTSFEDVIADGEVDLVVLATPNVTHCDLAIRAMDAGKHVVTDKVMCLNLAECDRMIAAAHRNGVVLSVFQNRRWDGDFLTLRRLLAEGKLGDLRWLEMAWQGFGPWGRWRGEMASGGGKLYDLGAHLVDQAVNLLPMAVTSVYCRMHHDQVGQTDTESHSLVVIGFEGGRTVVCDTSSMAAISKPRFNAYGTGGTFVKHGVDPQERAMIAGDIDSAVEDVANHGAWSDGKTTETIPTLPGRWRNYYENIGEVLAGKSSLAVTPESCRRAIAVLDAAFRSARTGEVVHTRIPALEPAKGAEP